ncbi:putative syntaxin 6 [Helianthus anomalus]
MESAYRTWVRQKKEGVKFVDLDELCRELQTAFGTAKWQLDEFQSAVRLSYKNSVNDVRITRHEQFVSAISSQISVVESIEYLSSCWALRTDVQILCPILYSPLRSPCSSPLPHTSFLVIWPRTINKEGISIFSSLTSVADFVFSNVVRAPEDPNLGVTIIILST